jgi:hypothetical protein
MEFVLWRRVYNGGGQGLFSFIDFFFSLIYNTCERKLFHAIHKITNPIWVFIRYELEALYVNYERKY